VIRFCCKSCGQKIKVDENHAGKKGRCPKCKNPVVVPQAPQPKNIEEPTIPQTSVLDPLLFDTSPKQQQQAPDPDIDRFQMFRKSTILDETEPPPERKLPWLIDIFLYPTNTPGLINIAIVIGIPFLIEIAMKALGPFAIALYIPSIIIKFVIGLYLFWYICECIRDSALGGLRAPETLSSSPGFGDMLSHVLNIVACYGLFWAPLTFYFAYTRNTDVIYWLLLGYGAIFFPMALLAITMFDSPSGLNPLLLLSSIFSTFFQYCGFVVIFYGIVWLLTIVNSILSTSPFWRNLADLFCIYVFMVTAHLLGRFYWKYQDKLYWEV